MIEHQGVCINNQWKPGTGPSFSSFNPATGERLWQGKEASKTDVNEAVTQATQAFEEWAALSIHERSRYLLNFSEALRDSQRFFAECISMETGKPLWDSMTEVDAMINKVGISLEAYQQRCAPLSRDQSQAHSITRHRPHGPLAVLGPYNFPGHLPNGHIIPALLAGNTLIFKPSEFTPLVAEETLRLWQQVDLPPGVINLVQGGRSTGQALIQHPAIQGILFTGSYSTGQLLAQSFGAQPSKILALEMGGNNPLIVGDIDNLQAAAYLALQSAYLSSGQRCTCARRLIVPATSKGAKVIAHLIDMIATISIGPYTLSPEPFMGPVISKQHVQKLLEAQENLRSKGGHSLITMRHLHPNTGLISPGLMDVTEIIERPDEEIFGPFLQIIRVKDFQEAINEANKTKFGLSAGLLSEKKEEYLYFYRHIHAGIVNWNTPLTGASSAAPFGGIKCSGNYRPSAYYAADYCAYPVASLENPQLNMPSIFPPGVLIPPAKSEKEI